MSQSELAFKNPFKFSSSSLLLCNNSSDISELWSCGPKLDSPSPSNLSSWLNCEATNLSRALQSVTFLVLLHPLLLICSSSSLFSDMRDIELGLFINGRDGLSSWGSCTNGSDCMNLMFSASNSCLHKKFCAKKFWGCLEMKSIWSTTELTPLDSS